MRKPKWEQVERDRGKPIKEVLVDEFDRHGSQVAVARSLGVGQSTLSIWLVKLKLKQHTVLKEI